MKTLLRIALLYALMLSFSWHTDAQTNCGWKLGELFSYSQGYWGGATVEARVLLDNFNLIYFSSGGALEVGIPGTGGNSIRLTNSSAVISFLPPP